MVLRLLALLLASALIGRCAVLRTNEAEPRKVHYDVHVGPGKVRCNNTVSLFAGPVDSRHECEVKCSAESACLFYHVFPGTQHYCKTSTSCDGFTKESVDGIIVYAKRGKAHVTGRSGQAPDTRDATAEKAPDAPDATAEKAAAEKVTVEAMDEEEDLEDPVADALVKSSKKTPTKATTSPKPAVVLKANMTAKEKLKAEKEAKKKEMEAEKKKLKAAKAEKKKLEAENKAKRKAEEEKEKAKKKEEKDKAKAAKKKATAKLEGKRDEDKKKGGKTLVMLQEQASSEVPTMAPIVIPTPRPTYKPTKSPTSTPKPTHEHVEVYNEQNPWTVSPTPLPTATPPTPAPTAFTETPTMAPPTPKPTFHPTQQPSWDHSIPWHPSDAPTAGPTPMPPPTRPPSPPVRDMPVRGCLPHNGTNLRVFNGSWRVGNNLNMSLDMFQVGHGVYWLLNVPKDHPVTVKVVGEHEFGMADPLVAPHRYARGLLQLGSQVSSGGDPTERYFGCHAIIRNGTTPDVPGSMDHRYGNFSVQFWGHCKEGATFDLMCHSEVSHGTGRFRYSEICDRDHAMNAADMSDGGVDEVQQSINGATYEEYQAAADQGVATVPIYERQKRQTPKNLHLWACPEQSKTTGRCGPYYGRCNDEKDPWAKYCNEATYWCGNTEDMRTRQTSDYWDAKPIEDCIIAPEASWKDAALYTNSQFPDRPYRKPKRHLFGKLPEYEEDNVTKSGNSTNSTLRTRRR